MKQQRKLKVLLVTTWYPCDENPFQGIFVREHARAAALYSDVTVLAFSVVGCDYQGDAVTRERDENGILTVRLRQKRSRLHKIGRLLNIAGQSRYCQYLIERDIKADVIHAHTFFAGVPSVLAGLRQNIPVVITEHWSGFPDKRLSWSEILQARFAMNRAQLIMPVSRHLESAILNYGIKNKTRIVPNVVDCGLFSLDKSQTAMQTSEKHILMIGSLSPVKGVTYLLKAVAKSVSNNLRFKLDIVGDGPSRMELEKETVESGLSDVVVFHGMKPKPELVKLMHRSCLLVLPSLGETFSCVLAEAMAAGLPVVSTNAGAIPEIVTEDSGILVPPGDVERLSQAIEFLLSKSDRYSPGKISEYACERFSHATVGRALDESYRQVIRDFNREHAP